MKVSKSSSTSATSTTTIEAAKFSLVNALKKYLQKALREAGAQMSDTDSTMNEDGSVTHKLTFMYTPEGADEPIEVEFYVNGKPVNEEKEYVDLSFIYPDLKTDPTGETVKKEMNKYRNVRNTHNEIMKRCQKMIDEVFDVDTLEDVPDNLEVFSSTSSDKMMKFTLNKTKSGIKSSDYKVELTNIFANYEPTEVYDDINMIVTTEEFLDPVEFDKPVSYGIVVGDDAYEVHPLPYFEDAKFVGDYKKLSYEVILRQAYKFYFDCKYIEYTACGRDMMRIVDYTTSYTWRLQCVIDTISKLIIADKFELDYPIKTLRGLEPVAPEAPRTQSEFYWEDFCKTMYADVQDFVNVLRLCGSNLASEHENLVQEWIRSWVYELNYVLTRSME